MLFVKSEAREPNKLGSMGGTQFLMALLFVGLAPLGTFIRVKYLRAGIPNQKGVFCQKIYVAAISVGKQGHVEIDSPLSGSVCKGKANS